MKAGSDWGLDKGFRTGYAEFPHSRDMRAIIEGYHLMIFSQIRHSMLFAQKAGPMAQSYLEGVVKFYQVVVDEVVPDVGIIFDPEIIGGTIVGPPPGWNGDEKDAVDTAWWKGYLDQVLKAILLRGPDVIPHIEPLKELGPSSFVDPDFLMDEEVEEEADYSQLFDVSHSLPQPATPVDGSGPSSVPSNDPHASNSSVI